jgi:hypothetical protein
MFINLTNHPSVTWNEEQRKAAEVYGEIVDIPFPLVGEHATEAEIKQLADKYVALVMSKGKAGELTVHVMGEQTFCYALIAKLQEKGVRCIASCTAHDTFVNDKGQKVSTFHFARFREYVPPRALRWWVNLRAKMRDFFNGLSQKESFCWLALALVLIAEVLGAVYQQTACPAALVAVGIIALSLLIIWCLSVKVFGHKFGIRFTIVSKLLANAIAPTPLGTLYLLAFVIHVGWLTNAVLGLFTERGADFCQVAFATLVCAAGLFFLIIFFPSGKEEKSDHPQKVFISGISAINFKILNFTPMVRMLQLTEDKEDTCKLYFLHSDWYFDKVYENKMTSNLSSYYEWALQQLPDDGCKDRMRKRMEESKDVTERLKVLIKMLAMVEFPQKTWIETGLTVECSPKSDYNNISKCFDVMSEVVNNNDDSKHVLYFNLSPGTANVSALMTLLAIDGDRSLYYYISENDPEKVRSITEEEKRSRLIPVDKKGIPLQALLSQALETVS